MEQAGSDLLATILSVIAVGIAIVGFQWRMTSALEKRITENADKAHAQIGENINRVEKHLGERIDRVEDNLQNAVKALTDRFDRHLEHHS